MPQKPVRNLEGHTERLNEALLQIIKLGKRGTFWEKVANYLKQGIKKSLFSFDPASLTAVVA